MFNLLKVALGITIIAAFMEALKIVKNEKTQDNIS